MPSCSKSVMFLVQIDLASFAENPMKCPKYCFHSYTVFEIVISNYLAFVLSIFKDFVRNRWPNLQA